jgi:hypothetical protein
MVVSLIVWFIQIQGNVDLVELDLKLQQIRETVLLLLLIVFNLTQIQIAPNVKISSNLPLMDQPVKMEVFLVVLNILQIMNVHYVL